MLGPPKGHDRGRQRRYRKLGWGRTAPMPGGSARRGRSKGPTRTVRRRVREAAGESRADTHDRSATIVEAGGSPSSEAPPGRLIRQAERQAPSLSPRGFGPG